MTIDEKIKQLRADGVVIYSYSRLSSFHNCQYEYHLTYNKRQKGVDNCYSSVGTFAHEYIESVYKDEKDKVNFSSEFNEKIVELDFLGVEFPSEQIKENFVADIKHYCENFKKLDGRYLLEKHFLVDVNGHYMQGYIDMINVNDQLDDEGNKIGNVIDVIDWKTSSKFTGAKLKDAGKQLIMYKLALESNGKAKIDKVKWCMLKYINVCHVQKNKKVKSKMCSRRKWVKEMENAFKKDMLTEGMDDLVIEIELDEAIKNNNIDNLPQFIKDKYWTEDCYVEYEVDEEKIQDFKNYVSETISAINTLDKNDDSQWKPLDLDKDSFYCNHLCNHRDKCKFLKEFKSNFNKENKKDELSLDDLFELN